VKLQITVEAAILVFFLIAAMIIIFVIDKAVPTSMEGSGSPEEYVQRGNALYSAGKSKFSEAAVQYWEATKRNPHIAEAHLKLAAIYYEPERLWNLEALNELAEVERIDPNNPELYLIAGKVYNRMGDSDKALEAFRRTIVLQPENSQAHYYLGTVYEQQDMKEEAIGEYEKAIKSGSDDETVLRAHLQLGRIYRNRESERAEREFRMALGINPASAEVISELRILYGKEAEDYRNQDDYDNVIAKYREILKIDPDNPRNVSIYMEMGDIYRNTEFYDEAAVMYEAAARIDPLNIDVSNALREIMLLRETSSEIE